jgi:hypothetical protein
VRIYSFWILVSICLLVSFGSAAAENELRVLVSGRPAEMVTIDWPNEGAKECVAVPAQSAFLCPLPALSSIQRIETYTLSVQGPQVDLGGPIYLRVFPTIPLPQIIRLDLSDGIFAPEFVATAAYWRMWQARIAQPLPDSPATLRSYLIARAYYNRVAAFRDSQTAWVLRAWMERAAILAQNGSAPIFAVDDAVVGVAEDLRQQMAKLGRAEIFERFGPTSADRDRLLVADWVLYGRLSNAAAAPAAKMIGYCQVFAALRARWPRADDERTRADDERTRALILRFHRVTEARIMKDATESQLSRCTTGDVAAGAAPNSTGQAAQR